MAEPIHDDVLSLIGETPLVRLTRVAARPGGGPSAEVCGKVESRNPSGSVKDRAALAMITAAERDGALSRGAMIVEATSGNTGISLAMIAAVRGYRCVLVMPEDLSPRRRAVLEAYGAEVILTPADEGMLGAVERAEALVASTPGAFMPRQFENPANPGVHELTTAREIVAATQGRLAAFVAGVGTGGTVTGVGRYLREMVPHVRVVAVEPRASAVLSGGRPGPHHIQGLGAGFVPDVFDRGVVDRVLTVSDADAKRMARRLATEEGLLVGLSSGANVVAALEVAAELSPDARVVTILCDTGERYLE